MSANARRMMPGEIALYHEVLAHPGPLGRFHADAAASLRALEAALTEALPAIDELAAKCASGPASVYLSDARLMPLVAIRDAVVSRCADCGERIDHGAWVCECHGTHRCKACDTQHLLSPTTSPTGEET
ncbi:MAG: hypothetical protein ACYC3F_16860 [Gemmatimonadaceae bacterium]